MRHGGFALHSRGETALHPAGRREPGAAGCVGGAMSGSIPTLRLLLLLACLTSLSGCGLVALPFRVTGDVIQAVPLIGKPIGKPIHAVGDVID